MKKLIVNNRYLIVLLLLVFPVILSLIHPGYYQMHDDVQAFRIHQMDKCFQDLQIPCRWSPDRGYQYGSPEFNYYSPGVYYLGEAIHLIGFQFIDSVKILFILGIFLSSITMYIFLKSFYGELSGLVGALIYTYAPFKAVEIFVRGDLTEFWAFVFYPLTLWSAGMLIKRNQRKYFVWFTISISLLILTHLLSSMIFLPIVGMGIFVYLIKNKQFRLLKLFILSGLLAFCLSGFFLLPVLFERGYVQVDEFTKGYFNYQLHFASFYQTFISPLWGYGASVWGNGDGMSFALGYVQSLISFLVIILAIYNFKRNKKLSYQTYGIFFVTIFLLFMTHQRSYLIWQSIPILSFIQFPWRFIGAALFFSSILGSLYIVLLPKRFRLIGAITVICLLIILNLGYFKPDRWKDITDNDKFSGKSWTGQLEVSVRDYLPIQTTFPEDSDFLPLIKPKDTPEVLEGKAVFKNYQKHSYYQKGKIIVKEPSRIRLPILSYPEMIVKVDDQRVNYKDNDCRGLAYCVGLISFNIPPGEHIIEVRLTNTPVRNIGNGLTLIGVILLIVVTLSLPKNVQKVLN